MPRPSDSPPESPTSLSFDRWLAATGTVARIVAEGADLSAVGEGPLGPVRLRALSPFSADAGVRAICAPALVRAEIGRAPGAASAWAPRRLSASALAFLAAGEGWTAGVLHAPEWPPGASDPQSFAVEPHPIVDTFLSDLSDLAGAEPDERQARLWRWNRRAGDELVEVSRGAFALAKRAAQLTIWAGGGAVTSGLLASTLGTLASPLVPVAAAAGAAAAVGLGLVEARRAARIRLGPVARRVHDSTKGCGLFARTTLSPERHDGWGALVLVSDGTRNNAAADLRADNRIEAATSDGAARLVVDTFAFPAPASTAPEAALLPEVWCTVEVSFDSRAPRQALGRLSPLSGGGSLGCWLTGRDVGGGAFDEDVLEPLGRHLRTGRIGPYR